ncbi:hypothetical protein BSLG_003509 [Batrachochytrium salamandrivorans]|nr:hypothetical protein BSLG_003624 [Batrachochytrium salamandrivorans]KAJ1341855.1 hypothetical protein BSLG_003509 [Batrachochytrium salamandrivorans]
MADDMTHDEILAQFGAVTGLENDQARPFLESSDWNLQTALGIFFEGNNEDSDESLVSQPPIASSSNAATSAATRDHAATPSAQQRPGSSRIKTFQELLASGGDDNDAEKDEGEDYYAGGEKSGVMMKGGPKEKKGGAFDLVKDILSKAAKSGSPPEDSEPEKKAPSFFSGAGYRLGSEDEPTSGSSQPIVQDSSSPESSNTETVSRHLTFWRNGFSIDDGPLLEYDDPSNQEFLKAINSGRAPTSLLNVAYGQPVEVKVAHRMQQDYQAPPKQPLASFSGAGNRLGAYPTSFTSALPVITPVLTPVSFVGPIVTVDPSQPSTSIQIRLGDGTRMVSKFNHTHTIQDVCSFVRASRPDGNSRAFVLQTTIPVRELTDLSMSIKDAGLLNAVVVQKFT